MYKVSTKGNSKEYFQFILYYIKLNNYCFLLKKKSLLRFKIQQIESEQQNRGDWEELALFESLATH